MVLECGADVARTGGARVLPDYMRWMLLVLILVIAFISTGNDLERWWRDRRAARRRRW